MTLTFDLHLVWSVTVMRQEPLYQSWTLRDLAFLVYR